jgi:hypothetical protein
MSLQELFAHFAVFALLVCLTVFIHGSAMWIAIKYSARRLSTMGEDPLPFARITSILGVVLIMLIAHLCEMILWGVGIFLLKLLPNLDDAYLYAMETYTTLGPRDARLPQSWRPMTGWLAATGILMFAWSTAILTSFLNRLVSGTRLLP